MAEQRLSRRGREDLQLRAVREILRASAASLPLDAILSVIANMVIIVADATTSFFMLAEEDCLHTTVARGEFADKLTGRGCAPGESVAWAVTLGQKPLVIAHADIDPNDPIVGLFAPEEESLVLLPLKVGQRVLGLLGAAVSWDGVPEIGFLATMAEQASAAVESARLREENRTWQERLDAVFAGMAEPVLVFDAGGQLVLMNAAADRVFGPKGLHVGDSSAELWRKAELRNSADEPVAAGESAVARALSGEHVASAEEHLNTASGSLYFLVSGVPLRSEGKVRGAVAVFRDISERKQAEDLREVYVSLISHDLRNPLTTVMGQADWLRRLLERQGFEREVASARAIVAGAKRMNVMIQELVDSARLESGHLQMHRAPVDLLQLLAELVERVGTPEERARVSVEAPEWVPPVLADSSQVERALTNILTNALKYSEPDTPVAVLLSRREGRAVVAVTDRGPGIAPADLPHVFERHYRAATATPREGLGLGLYITRLIAEAHGGEVYVESTPGKGSTFYFSLPLA
jgi:two-component system, OmpR family, phosphate regulon sensor histidine kinase PhoR